MKVKFALIVALLLFALFPPFAVLSDPNVIDTQNKETSNYKTIDQVGKKYKPLSSNTKVISPEVSKKQNSDSSSKNNQHLQVKSLEIGLDTFLDNPTYDSEVDDWTYYGNGYEMNGTATDAADKPFPNIDVELYINKSQSDITQGLVAPDQTTTTDGSGYYAFPLSYTQSDVGDFNYTVFYQDQDSGDPELGIPCYNCNKTVDFRDVRVKDKLLMTYVFEPNRPTIGPAETYTITINVSDSLNNPLSSPEKDPIVIRVDRNFGNIADDFDTNTLDANSQAIFTDSYPGTSDDTVTFTLTLQNYDSQQLKFFTIDDSVQQQSFTKTIDSQFTFGLSGTISGVPMPGDDTTRYFRTGQQLNISGDLSNQTVVSQSEYANINWEITITGGGYTGSNPAASGTTNSNGDFFTLAFSLNTSTFQDPSSPIVFEGWVDNNNVGNVTFEVYMQATATTLQNVNINAPTNVNDFVPGIHWANNGSTYQITGDVLDEAGVVANGVPVTLHFTDQDFTGQGGTITDAPSFSQTTQTGSSGGFSFNFEIPDLPFQQQNITVNVTIGENAIWNDPTDLTNSVATFQYLHKLDLDANTVELSVFNGTQNTLGDDQFFLFNNTYADYHNPGLEYYYNITIRDVYGRVPHGMKITYFYDEHAVTTTQEAGSTATTDYFVNKTNNGILLFAVYNTSSYSEVTNLLKLWGSQFIYRFTIAQGQSSFQISSQQFGQDITLFGPDNDGIDPSLVDLQIDGANTERRTDINIVANLDSLASSLDNIRNVTIAYKITPTGGINNSEFDISIFDSIPWTYDNMTFNTVDFVYSFPFASYGNGYWFLVKIMIYDLTGFGIDENGNTVGGNTFAGGLPSYNPALALYDSSIYRNDTRFNSTTGLPFVLKMGDTEIQKINVSQSVLVNGNSIEDGYNITTTTQNVTIVVILPIDSTGYSQVLLSYRFLTELSSSGILEIEALDTSIPYTTVSMNLLANETNAIRFIYVIPNSELQYNTVLDFVITVKDTSGNEYTTESFVDNQGNIKPNLKTTKVLDLTAPTLVSNNFVTLRDPSRGDTLQLITIWANESRLDYPLFYNVTDVNGTGIESVIVSWYVDNVFQQVEILVENGTIIGTNTITITDGFQLNFVIPESLFQSGVNITWVVNVTDFSGNSALLNNDPARKFYFDIVEPPQPPVTTTSIITGPVEEGTNNALWIIAGFFGIMGLLALYYQRHNIRELWDRRQRRKKVEGTLAELTDEIKRLGAEGRYRRAILLTWEALERVSREILQAPRKYNQTASEYANYLSTITIVDRDTLLTISSVFEAARYGHDDPSQDDWDDAVKALEIIVRTIIESGARSRITDDDDW